MNRYVTVFITSLAPMIWGSSYVVTTELLPANYPLTISMLRALPAGLLLLLLVRRLPTGWKQWGQIFVLGGLNFTLFWYFLIEATYRLPGGIAATMSALQPIIVVFLSWLILKQTLVMSSLIAAVAGFSGVALLVVSANASFDTIGLLTSFGAGASMAFGTVLSRYWQPKENAVTFTAWQLTAGGILLVPIAFIVEPALPSPTMNHMIGYIYLSLIGAALTYFLWFQGLAKLTAVEVSILIFLSPISAVLLGWVILDQYLNFQQVVGFAVVLLSIWISQRGIPFLSKKEKLKQQAAD